MNFEHILLATDLSEPNQDLFEFVAYQAKMTGARVTILNVLEPFRVPTELSRVIWNPERLHNMEEDYKTFAQQELQKLTEKHMHGETVETASLVSAKSAGETIVDYAGENGVDLIALSSHRRGALGQLLLGSTVQKALTLATVPVMVIPVQLES